MFTRGKCINSLIKKKCFTVKCERIRHTHKRAGSVPAVVEISPGTRWRHFVEYKRTNERTREREKILGKKSDFNNKDK